MNPASMVRVAFCVLLLSSPLALQAREPAPARAPATNADAAFATLADEFFDSYYFPTNPTTATATGIHAYDGKLEDYSRAGVDSAIAQLQKWDKRVSAVDTKSLDEQTRGDRQLVLNYIHSTLLTLQTIRPWEKNPDTYSSGITGSAFVIMERKFAPLPDRLKLLIEREKLMPGVLQAARVNLKNPPKIYTEIALEQLPGLVAFFTDDVPAAFKDVTDATLQKNFAASNGAVIKALSDYASWLKSDLLPKSNGDFRIGADAYRKKL